MKKISIIISILVAFSALLVFAGCDSSSDKEPTEATFKEPTITVSESATFSFKKNTSTTKATKPTKAKDATKATKAQEKTTAYVEYTEEEYTEAYTESYNDNNNDYDDNNGGNSSGYIDYGTLSSRYLTDSDVSGLDADTVQSIINDMYASHGYIFQTPSIREYYESQDWYNGYTTSQEEAESNFNSYEEYNKDFLANYR